MTVENVYKQTVFCCKFEVLIKHNFQRTSTPGTYKWCIEPPGPTAASNQPDDEHLADDHRPQRQRPSGSGGGTTIDHLKETTTSRKAAAVQHINRKLHALRASPRFATGGHFEA
uniref:Uncharacterized protein n=1 Tax=Acrobeloides nanus TaxID=290746 RepID=A0A914E1V1_9BILA